MAWLRSRWAIAGVSALALLIVIAVTIAAAQWVTRPGGEGNGSAARPSSEVSTEAGTPSPSESPCAAQRLILGSLAPQTGSQAFLGPPVSAAVIAALADIDAAGGVLGAPVVLLSGDAGDPGSVASATAVARLVSQGVQAIVGPTSSAGVLEIIDDVTGAGIVMVSPAGTSPSLTAYPDGGLFFRTVPSDALQGIALADTARDLGLTRAATIVREDAYGLGIQEAFGQRFADSGGTVVASATYAPGVGSFADVVTQVREATPDTIAVVGFEESAALMREMIRQGVGPQQVQVLLAEGGVSRLAYADLPRGSMDGVVGAVPARGPVAGRKAFQERLLGVDPTLTTFAYAAEAYDAAILLAVAAEYAGCAEGTAIAEALPRVSTPGTGPGSAVCGTFADCREIILRGGEPNYEGVSGSLDLNEFGEPATGRVEIVRYTSNTRYDTVEVLGPLPLPDSSGN
jgi:ABC-type branched-subunit amino acid transport system substrate-binding protein